MMATNKVMYSSKTEMLATPQNLFDRSKPVAVLLLRNKNINVNFKEF